MLRTMKILLVLSVALWGLLGAFGNVSDWAGTTGAVSATASMSTFDAAPTSGRGTTNSVVILAGAVGITSAKIIAALLCLAGAWRMWGARAGSAAEFGEAKTSALTGCGVAVFMLFFGFIVIGEGWFEIWRSEALRDVAAGSAFRYAGMIALIALFVGARND